MALHPQPVTGDRDATLERCVTLGPGYRISGSDISLFLESPFSLYCKHFVDRSERDPPDASQTLFSEYGHSHETRLMRELYSEGDKSGARLEQAPSGASAPATSKNRERRYAGKGRGGRHKRWLSPEEHAAQLDRARIRGFEKTLGFMRSGSDSLLEPQLCFFPQGMHGSPDILERRDGESNLGAYHYVVKEIKSSRKIRKKHIMQAAFYNMMLGEIQEYVPDEFYLLNAEGEDAAFRYDDYKDDITGIISDVAGIKNGKMPPVTYGKGVFPWSNYCDKVAVLRDDLSLITGMEGGLRSKLESNGVGTVGALLDASEAGLEKMGVSKEVARRYVARASAIKTAEAVRLGPSIPVPDTPTTIFLRVEEGMSGEAYMMGALVRTRDTDTYTSFVSKGPDAEGEMLREFLDSIGRWTDYMIYYWGSGGETPLSGLMRRHNTDGTVPEIPMTDLQKLATSVVAFPTYRDKLKSVAEWLGFEWTDAEADWGKGVLMYRQYIKNTGRRFYLDYIKEYNRDNCLAIATVWAWLVERKYLEQC